MALPSAVTADGHIEELAQAGQPYRVYERAGLTLSCLAIVGDIPT
jgi:hypothetical protein